MSILSAPHFHDADKAREWLETELWANGRVCPHCGVVDQSTKIAPQRTKPSKAHPEGKLINGLYKCNACRKQFTVMVGTIYESSHVPLNKWLAATQLMMSSKKGMSALEVGRLLGLSKKTAWFLCHRIREATRTTTLEPVGGVNKVVEADEAYIGGKESNKHLSKRQPGMQGGKGKEAVFSLVERDGKVRSFHLPDVTAKNLKAVLHAQVDHKSYLMTDEAPQYVKIADVFSGHGTVNHSADEYVRGGFWHTNTVEGFFSIVKRAVYGTHHHISQQHLARYLAERDFVYNNREKLGVNDAERMVKAVRGIVGKRLTYRRPVRAEATA